MIDFKHEEGYLNLNYITLGSLIVSSRYILDIILHLLIKVFPSIFNQVMNISKIFWFVQV